MSRVRSSMVLLGVCVVSVLIGALRLVTQPTPLPAGSSYSGQPNGALGLYTWSASLGSAPGRWTDIAASPALPRPLPSMLMLQPESPIDPASAAAFDAVADAGGTLIVAGDSLAWLLYTRGLGVTVEAMSASAPTASTPEADLTLHVGARYRVRARAASPLLIAPSGDWVALRMPYRQGSVIVLATPEPLTNAALNDPQTARFVYRQIVSPATPTSPLVFDEVHHSFSPPSAGATSLGQLLFSTPPGRALLYAAVVLFGYLVLTGRRLGPPLLGHQPAQTRRTMYEHVQMLADLYRRSGQLPLVRASFSRHYRRALARGGAGSPTRAARLAAALTEIEAAGSEAALVAAVAHAEA